LDSANNKNLNAAKSVIAEIAQLAEEEKKP
jgi:hypothetical protein